MQHSGGPQKWVKECKFDYQSQWKKISYRFCPQNHKIRLKLTSTSMKSDPKKKMFIRELERGVI